jgi:hypothetical protein
MGQVPATAWLVVAEMFSFEDLDETYKKMGKDVKKKTWENMGQPLRIGGLTYKKMWKSNWRVSDVEKQLEKQRLPFTETVAPQMISGSDSP